MESPNVHDDDGARKITLREIELARDAVIDWDIVVTDRRQELDVKVEEFRLAVAERERANVHLAQLIADYARTPTV